jgi:glycosyltransferase involved in cell wall biosynthesis
VSEAVAADNRPVVHQFTAVLAGRDAVGDHTVRLHRLLIEMGCDAAIYAAHVHPDVRDLGRDFRRHRDDPRPDLIIYQASTGTPVADYLVTRREPLVLDYHNMTPPEFFDPWEPAIGAELYHGRRQLARLGRRAVLGLADSAFNGRELVDAGVSEVVVAPILFDVSALGVAGGLVPAGLGEGRPVWLFVGRLAPNKAQHDVIAAFAAYRAEFGPGARLVLVGVASSGAYEAALVGLAESLGVADAVVFAGSVSAEELAGWYGVADVFVCLSEHEGFCVPLLEAMHHRVPVVAFDSSAVPETLAGAGLVLADKSPVVVAEAVDRVVSDPVVASRLVDRGVERLADFDLDTTAEVYRETLTPLLGP